MKKQPFNRILLIFVLLTGCQAEPPITPPVQTASVLTQAAGPTFPGLTAPLQSTSAATAGSQTMAQTSAAASPLTRPSDPGPVRGILSDASEYGPGNPKTHAAEPVRRDLSRLSDKTRKENEKYRSVFEEYLEEVYPEYDFRVTDIMDFQTQGRTVKKSRAYAAQSLDTSMDLLFDGAEVTDSFEREVIGRRNTMNRWRSEFRSLLEPLLKQAKVSSLVTPDVSYDYYSENIPLIRLDEPLDPKDGQFVRCLELYVQRGLTDPIKISQAAQAAYQAILLDGYSFRDYFIYLEDEAGGRTTFQVPARLIGNASFSGELQKALAADHPENLIRRTDRPAP